MKKKLEMVRVYCFDQLDLEPIDETKNKFKTKIKDNMDLTEKEVKMGSSFLIESYCRYFNLKLEDNMLIENIIKVTLSSNKSEANKQAIDGIMFNGDLYVGWFATTNGMKQEERDEETETKSKCEMLFIKKDEFYFTV